MIAGIVSMRYAKALFAFAQANNEASKVYSEMLQVSNTFEQLPAFKSMLQNPVLSDDKKVNLIVKAGSIDDTPTLSLRRFADLLARKQRINSLQSIALTFGDLYREDKGIIRGKLTLPVATEKHITAKLQQWIEKRTQTKVDFEVCIDPEIEGGFIIEYDTYRLDVSVRSKLNYIKRALTS